MSAAVTPVHNQGIIHSVAMPKALSCTRAAHPAIAQAIDYQRDPLSTHA
jgi:hypothetical protein